MSEAEISIILGELETLMGQLRGNVGALQAILSSPPEVPVDDAPA